MHHHLVTSSPHFQPLSSVRLETRPTVPLTCLPVEHHLPPLFRHQGEHHPVPLTCLKGEPTHLMGAHQPAKINRGLVLIILTSTPFSSASSKWQQFVAALCARKSGTIFSQHSLLPKWINNLCAWPGTPKVNATLPVGVEPITSSTQPLNMSHCSSGATPTSVPNEVEAGTHF